MSTKQQASLKNQYKQSCGCVVALGFDEYTDGRPVVDEAWVTPCALHAAAPALLKAAKRAITQGESQPDGVSISHQAWEDLRAAIATAEGR